MTSNTLFSLSFLLVIPFWALMIFFPTWRWTQRIIASPFIIAPAALVYAAVTLPGFLESYTDGFDFTSLSRTAEFFGQEQVTLGNWLHFAAVDLFVGRWVYLDSRRRELPLIPMSIVLLLMLNSTPTVLLLYLVIRSIYSHYRSRRTHSETGTK